MNKLNKRASRLAAGIKPARPRWALVALLLLSCAAALLLAYPAIRDRRENARLKEELRHQQHRTQHLRGLLDTLATGKRPAPIYNL